MPRVGRKKSTDAIYHVMSRSISEIDLFQCDQDKLKYLELLKERIEKYKCKVYAYCLMDNHVHLYINPQGFDVSKLMLSLNTAYVVYYNKQYKRHGHLFQGRFASKIIDNDTYSLTLSAYIHNNAKDMQGYAGNEEAYPYSSYGIYTGARKDYQNIVDTGFLLSIFSSDREAAQQKYRIFTESMRDTGIMKEVDDKIMKAYTENQYRSEKQHIVRYDKPDELVKKVGALLDERLPEVLRMKHSRETSSVRAFTAYIMRALCGYSYKNICQYIGNMSMSGVSRLSSHGFRLVGSDPQYRMAFNSLVS